METIVAIMLLMSGPEPAATYDHVVSCEHNSYYDEHGKHVFDQLIYRAWVGNDYHITDWRLVKHCDQIPAGRRAIWFDGTCLRKVTATSVYHTWTQAGVTGDPELEARKELDKDRRRELTRPPSRTRAKELTQRHKHAN